MNASGESAERVLEVRDLSVSYGKVEALSNANLDVGAGQSATHGVLQCAATARVMVFLDGLAPAPGGRRIELVLRHPNGDFVDARECVPAAGATLQFALGIPPGSYRIECRTTDGLGAVVDLTGRDAEARPSLHFVLR